MIKMYRLFQNVSTKGNTYYSYNIGRDSKLIAFLNEPREGKEETASIDIFLAERKKQEETSE